MSYLSLPDRITAPEIYSGVTLKRGLAWIVDTIIVTAIAVVLVPLTAFVGAFFFPALILVVNFFYRLMTINGGSATWGMRLMSIELRKLDGSRLDGQEAFMHTLGFTISVALPVLQLISVAMMIIDSRGRGLTDTFMNTTAVNRLQQA